MASVSITLDEELTKVAKWPPAIAKSLPFMLQQSMATGAKKSADALAAQLTSKLHQPKKRTTNGVFPRRERKPSTKNLVVSMGLKGGGPKDPRDGVPTSAAWYLKSLVRGTRRRPKGSEMTLYRSGKLRKGQYIVPTGSKSFPLDSRGNISKGKYVKVLSRIKGFSEQGFTANTTRGVGSRGRSGRKRSQEDFFLGAPGAGGRKPWMQLGIHKRVGPRPTGNPGGRGRPVTTNLPRGYNTVFWVPEQAPRYKKILFVGTTLSNTFMNTYHPAMVKEIKSKVRRIINQNK